MKYYTTQEVAQIFGKARITIIKRCLAMGIQKVGRDYVITEEDIRKMGERYGEIGTDQRNRDSIVKGTG